MYQVTKQFDFCAAHRIEGHPKCGRMHGHNYEVYVTAEGTELDEMGMLVDFNVLKALAKPLIDELDHRYLVSKANIAADDPYLQVAVQRGDALALPIEHSTAECLASYLAHEIMAAFTLGGAAPNVRTIQVMVSETPSSNAHAECC